MSDPDFRLLPSFVALAEDRSFTRAASRLFMTQPALSLQIQTLEAQLGMSLFRRASREVELTSEGLRLLPDVDGCGEFCAEPKPMGHAALSAASTICTLTPSPRFTTSGAKVTPIAATECDSRQVAPPIGGVSGRLGRRGNVQMTARPAW